MINDFNNRGLEESLWKVVRERRNIIREAISNTELIVADVAKTSKLPVEWLENTHGNTANNKLFSYLLSNNIHLLPGHFFYWKNPDKGKRYLRVALLKPEQLYYKSVYYLKEILKKLNRK